MMVWLALFFALTVAGTWLARGYAVHRNLIDHPGERRSHAAATPRGGGIAIVVAMLAATLALAMRDPWHAAQLLGFALALLLVAGIGWWDDHQPLSVRARLGVHGLAGLILSVVVFSAYGDLWLAIAALAATMVLTNVWNFMDGINGLAVSQTAVVAAGLAVVLSGNAWAWAAWALVAACVGFLPFNFPRARIFLGDVGSGALGFSVAALAVMAAGAQRQTWPLVLLPLAPFVTDTGLTLARRIWRREPWWTAHTQHAYQGWARDTGHAPVTLAYAAWTSFGVMLAAGLRDQSLFFMLAVVLAWYMSCAFLWWWLQRRGAGTRQADRMEWRKE